MQVASIEPTGNRRQTIDDRRGSRNPGRQSDSLNADLSRS